MKRDLVELSVESIRVKSPLRGDLGDVESLANSVRQLGLLVPLVVDRHDVLISGARRLEACRRVGLTTVPAWRMDTEYDSIAALDVCSAENLCREPLSAEDVERLIRSKKQAMSGTGRLWRAVAGWFRKIFRRG
jgi:ParB family chromosome partitioning protein